MALILQEVSTERTIDIPEPIRDVYRMWRPSPLIRARRLEQALGTPAKIYFKYEGVSPAGSHKPNTAVPQAWYNKEQGVTRLSTETGAGQWGSALAFAGSLFGMEVTVFQVRVSYDQKPYRRALMETYGARCIASPSNETNSGRAILAKYPEKSGLARHRHLRGCGDGGQGSGSEIFARLGAQPRAAAPDRQRAGSDQQFEMAGDDPDIVIGCTGGGSTSPASPSRSSGCKLRGGRKRRFIAVEPAACPTLTRGKYAYDFGDTAHLTPLVKMHTLGTTFIPPGIHAGGLRYHGMAPMISHIYELGLIEARAYHQKTCFDAGVQFARCEGIVPTPEARMRCAAPSTRHCAVRKDGKEKTILFNLLATATSIWGLHRLLRGQADRSEL